MVRVYRRWIWSFYFSSYCEVGFGGGRSGEIGLVGGNIMEECMGYAGRYGYGVVRFRWTSYD